MNVLAANITVCEYSGYKSNQDDNGKITISVNPDNGQWTVQSSNHGTKDYNFFESEFFTQTDTFDRVFSNVGVGKDIAITTADYNALKSDGTCPSSAIRTNKGSSNIYFGEKATEIAGKHNFTVASASYSWSSNASSQDKEALSNYFTNGVSTIKDGNVSWIKSVIMIILKIILVEMFQFILMKLIQNGELLLIRVRVRNNLTKKASLIMFFQQSLLKMS